MTKLAVNATTFQKANESWPLPRNKWHRAAPFLTGTSPLLPLALSFAGAFTALSCLGCVSTLQGHIGVDPGVGDGDSDGNGFLVRGSYLAHFYLRKKSARREEVTG